LAFIFSVFIKSYEYDVPSYKDDEQLKDRNEIAINKKSLRIRNNPFDENF
jgi:hypothetical protein